MKLWILTLGLLISSPGKAQLNQSGTAIQNVDYCRLTGQPQSFGEKRVRVRGVYWSGFEIQRLGSPQCCAGNPIKMNVKFNDMDRHSKRLFRRLEKHNGVALVVFVGTFESNGPYGTFADSRQLVVDRIEKIERTSRYAGSQHNGPEWVPNSCTATGKITRRRDSINGSLPLTFLHGTK